MTDAMKSGGLLFRWALLALALCVFPACFESARLSSAANTESFSDGESAGAAQGGSDEEAGEIVETQTVLFGDNQNSAVNFFATASYRMILSQDAVLEGGYRASADYDFYFNDNHFDLILEVEP